MADADLVCLTTNISRDEVVIWDKSDLTLEFVDKAAVVKYLRRGGIISHLDLFDDGVVINRLPETNGVFATDRYVASIETFGMDYYEDDILYNLRVGYKPSDVAVCLNVVARRMGKDKVILSHEAYDSGEPFFVPTKDGLVILYDNSIVGVLSNSILRGYGVSYSTDMKRREILLK